MLLMAASRPGTENPVRLSFFDSPFFAVVAATLLVAACGGGGKSDNNNGGSSGPPPAVSVKVMGDSLADSGTFEGTSGYGRIFSVQGSSSEPNVLWTERTAAAYGAPRLCSYYRYAGSEIVFNTVSGCTSYAIGGARINNLSGGAASPLSILRQLQQAGNNGFAATDLVLIDGGGNDAADLVGAYLRRTDDNGVVFAALLVTVLSGSTTADVLSGPDGAANAGRLYMRTLADRFFDAIQANTLDKGAKRVAVLNIPAIANTPRFQAVLELVAQANGGGSNGAAVRAQLQAMFDSWVTSYNTQLASRAAGNSALRVVDFYSGFADELANPARYGLTNVTQPACPAINTGSDGLQNYDFATCTAALLSSPAQIPPGNPAGAAWWTTYLFSDGFHPTPYGHKLLADSVATPLRQAGWL